MLPSKIMQNVAFLYARWINSGRRLFGHQFQCRYPAIRVDADSCLPELVRYFHLNPAWAALVTIPLNYPRSSRRAYLGHKDLPWLNMECVLSAAAPLVDLARDRHQHVLIDDTGEAGRAEPHNGGVDRRVLDDHRFIQQTLGMIGKLHTLPLPSLDEIVISFYIACDVTRTELVGPGRACSMTATRGVISRLALRYEFASLCGVAEGYYQRGAVLSISSGRKPRPRSSAMPSSKPKAPMWPSRSRSGKVAQRPLPMPDRVAPMAFASHQRPNR